jgi:hypothetical protein
MVFKLMGYDKDGIGHLIDTFENRADAEECLAQCAEGDDKHDPWEYFIEE